jgi:DNA-nicking Smr family endonuclease
MSVTQTREKKPKVLASPSPAPFRLGASARPSPKPHDLAPTLSTQIERQPVTMDKKRFGQMKKGRLTPDARIDLHGMTIAEAHPALVRFVLSAVSQQRRLVLVITGKGKSRPDTGVIPERHGALRHQVPHWLHSAPLKAHVLQISEAHVKHGGQGAYYVYLRRPR